MPIQRIIPMSLTPLQAAVQRQYMKGLSHRNLGATGQRTFLGDNVGRPTQDQLRRLAATKGPAFLNNAWQIAAAVKAPYIFTVDRLGIKLGPRNTLGDGNDAAMATEQGDVSVPGYAPTVVPPAPGTERETILVPGNAGITVTQPFPPPLPEPSWQNNFLSMLTSPVVPGSNFKNWHVLAGLTFVGAVAIAKSNRGRR